jgi:hypothetical protein
MRVSFEPFWLPKAGNSDEEYEDAFWPKEPLWEQDREAFCCAVADGATETSFSKLWAKLLVQASCEHVTPAGFVATLPDLQGQWREVVDSRSLPWYAEQKAQSGAFAALLAVQVTADPDAMGNRFGWQAFAVGDACLLQMRGNELITSFPLTSSEQFGYLICSRRHADDRLEECVRTASGVCQPGDTLYLMTDALACWFLSRQELGGVNEDSLRKITNERRFERLVERERQERDIEGRPHMRNDDMTLIRLVVSS